MQDQAYQLPQEGEKLGSGVVVGLINSGGSAHVYKTWNDALELHRAVKVVSPSAESDVFDRFATEARISSKLLHANIVQCFNTGTTRGNLPFLEMEYISGPSVDDLIRRRGALPLPVALSFAVSILEGLSYAHSVRYTLYERQYLGLIHRDLKPSNIVVASDGIPKLTDFGIARPVDVSFHTQQGTVPGTIAYMSPEACAGSDIDFRSDIYQLGLCLYEFLSGTMAFPQSDLTSLLKAKTRNDYAPLDSLVKTLDPRVISIVKKCLELKAEDRYPSAKACLSALRPLFNGLVSSACPAEIILAYMDDKPLPLHSSRSFTVPRPVLIAAVSLVVIALFGLTVNRYAAYIFPFLSSAFQRIDPPPVPAPDTAAVADSTAQEDTLALDSSPTPSPRRRPPGPRRSPRPAVPPVLAPRPPEKPSIPSTDAFYHINEGKSLYKSGDYPAAFQAFQKALRMHSSQPRRSVVEQSVYWSAKCNTALYRRGKCPQSNFAASWRSVKSTFPAGSTEHTEAVALLKEVRE